MPEQRTYYVTTPIYYVNDAPHIGHLYTTLACDVLARFKRLDGFRVKFLTGTDEHGQKVQKAAREAGIAPLAFADAVSQNFRDLAAALGFTNDDFVRTTEERHKRACAALWERLRERDQIYLGSYAGWYAVRDEAFYAESELATGPDGAHFAPSGAPVEWVEEPSYFFRLSTWADALLEHYAQHPEFIGPESRRNEVVSFVRGGLQDLSVSRTTFDWGVPVPGDPDHVMYVWLDALTNYLTGVGFPDAEDAEFSMFWPADLHMVGKDILRFHAVYWPAFLMAAGVAPPRRVFAHGWWTNEGRKISKSLGNTVEPFDLIKRYGVDAVRYFLLREVPFGQDGDFSQRAIVGRINGDLANDLGNLAQRTLSMIAKNCGGVIPKSAPATAEDAALLAKADGMLERARALLDQQQFHLCLIEIWDVVAACNRYIDREAPWSLRRTDPPRMEGVLAVLAAVLRQVAILLQPFTPDAAGRLLDQLGAPKEQRDFSHFGIAHQPIVGTPLPPPKGVFPRYVAAEGEE